MWMSWMFEWKWLDYTPDLLQYGFLHNSQSVLIILREPIGHLSLATRRTVHIERQIYKQ